MCGNPCKNYVRLRIQNKTKTHSRKTPTQLNVSVCAVIIFFLFCWGRGDGLLRPVPTLSYCNLLGVFFKYINISSFARYNQNCSAYDRNSKPCIQSVRLYRSTELHQYTDKSGANINC